MFIHYDFEIQANFSYNPSMVTMPARDPRLQRFTKLIWHGYEARVPVVYKADPSNGEVVRIIFLN